VVLKYLSTVKEVFQLPHIGCTLVPGIPSELRNEVQLNIGDEIELRFPSGDRRKARIEGLNLLCGTESSPSIPISLSRDFTKEDIPIGTGIWVSEGSVALPLASSGLKKS
jgi:hypothetical protein